MLKKTHESCDYYTCPLWVDAVSGEAFGQDCGGDDVVPRGGDRACGGGCV